MRPTISAAAAAVVALIPGTVFAQNVPLATILPRLLVNSVTMTSTAQGVAGNPHEAHFIAALGQNRVPFEIDRLVASQLSTFPIGSSSGGFVFDFNPATGLFTPASRSFGSGFAERALTNGAGRFGFGLNYQHLTLKSYEGADLQNGELAFVLQHNDCCGTPAGNSFVDPPFEGDLVRMELSLNTKTDVVAPFVSYGLSRRWDVGVVVPFVRVQLAPTINASIDRVATCPDGVCTGLNQFIHSWNGQGQTTKVTSMSGSASGIGDVVFRTKYRFLEEEHGGLAAGVDLRVPSGDKENLLGTGAVQTKLSLIGSDEFGIVSPHVNFGYTVSRGELSASLTTLPLSNEPANPATQSQIGNATGVALADPHLPNEINYVAGIDIAAHPLLTISADVLGRTFLDVQRFARVSKLYLYRATAGGPTLETRRDIFDTTGTGTLNTVLGVIGGKLNIPGTPLLVTANVIFPLNHSGLSPKVTPVVGLDYAFK
jgi:hypothetical protein